MPPTPKIKKCKKYIQMAKFKSSKICHLEGFRQNGYQIRIQGKKLRISALVKIVVGHFLKNDKQNSKNVKHRNL